MRAPTALLRVKQKEGGALLPQADGTVAATATPCDAQGSKLTKGQTGRCSAR